MSVAKPSSSPSLTSTKSIAGSASSRPNTGAPVSTKTNGVLNNSQIPLAEQLAARAKKYERAGTSRLSDEPRTVLLYYNS